MAKKKSTQEATPGARDFGSEMGMINQYAQGSAEAQAAQAAATNQALVEQALMATDKIAGKLDNSYTAAGKASLDASMGQVGQMDSLASRMGALSGQAEGDVAGTAIERQLQQQALSDLAMGRSLSPEQVRESQQAARSGFAARGMATGPGSLAAEILNRDAYATARENARRSFAGEVNQTLTSNRVQRLSTAGNLLGQTAGVRQNAAQLGLAGAQGYIAIDPYARALGSNIPIASQGTAASMTTNAYGQTMQYGSDLFNTNFNADWSNYTNNQNNALALQSGQMQANAATSAASTASKGQMTGALIGAGGAIVGAAAVF